MAPLTKNEKKNPLLPITVMRTFERSCYTFRRGRGKKLSIVVVFFWFAQKNKIKTMGWMLACTNGNTIKTFFKLWHFTP